MQAYDFKDSKHYFKYDSKNQEKSPEKKEPIESKQHLMWFADYIDSIIHEIESAEIDLIDREKSIRFISFLKHQKKQWIDTVVFDSSYNLVNKTVIVNNVVAMQMEYTNYFTNMAKNQIQKIKGERLIEIFKTLLGRVHHDEQDFSLTMQKMFELEEHYRLNMSSYEDISDVISFAIYEKYKYFYKKYNVIFSSPEIPKEKIISVIQKDVIKEAKEISIGQYEDSNKLKYQNEIRMFLTLNNLSNPANIDILANLIFAFHREKDDTVRVGKSTSIENISNDQDYKKLLDDIDSIKKSNFSIYMFFIIQLHNTKLESVDENNFYSDLGFLNEMVQTYKNKDPDSYNNLFNEFDRIALNNQISSLDFSAIYPKYINTSSSNSDKLRKYFKAYKSYLLFYSKMIVEKPIDLINYSNYEKEIVMMGNLINNNMVGPSLDGDISQAKVKKEITKLLNCDFSLKNLWKLNSYVRLYLGKSPAYINVYKSSEDSYVKYSTIYNKLKSVQVDQLDEMVSDFYSELILIEPFYSENAFSAIFKEKLKKITNIVQDKFDVSLGHTIRTYEYISLNYKSIENSLKTEINLKKEI